MYDEMPCPHCGTAVPFDRKGAFPLTRGSASAGGDACVTTCPSCAAQVIVGGIQTEDDIARLADESARTLGRALFDAYNANAAGVNYQFKPTPAWDELPPRIRGNWIAAALKVRRPLALSAHRQAIREVGPVKFGFVVTAEGVKPFFEGEDFERTLDERLAAALRNPNINDIETVKELRGAASAVTGGAGE